jgi:hypothetical protein
VKFYYVVSQFLTLSELTPIVFEDLKKIIPPSLPVRKICLYYCKAIFFLSQRELTPVVFIFFPINNFQEDKSIFYGSINIEYKYLFCSIMKTDTRCCILHTVPLSINNGFLYTLYHTVDFFN